MCVLQPAFLPTSKKRTHSRNLYLITFGSPLFFTIMAVTVASPIYKSTAGRTRQVFNSHTYVTRCSKLIVTLGCNHANTILPQRIYRIPGIEDFSTDELNAACADIQYDREILIRDCHYLSNTLLRHSENTTDLNGAALYSALQSVLKYEYSIHVTFARLRFIP